MARATVDGGACTARLLGDGIALDVALAVGWPLGDDVDEFPIFS